MAILTADERKKLPDTAFALPGRRYPIHNEAHARNALARAATNATPAEQATIRAKVKKKFPGISEKNENPKEEASETPKQEKAEQSQENIQKMYKKG